MLWAADQEIGRLLSKVDLDSTTVILVGDNGTPTGQIVNTNLYDSSHSKGTIYAGGIHVPFIIRPPGGTTQTQIDSPVSGVDLFPTMCEIMGIDYLALGQDLYGVTLSPLMNGTSTEDHIVVSEAFFTTPAGRTLRKGDFKLNIHDIPTDHSSTPTVEFFDMSIHLDEDPADNLWGTTLTATQQLALDELLAENSALNTPALSFLTEALTSSLVWNYYDLTGLSGINTSTQATSNQVPELGAATLQSVRIGNDSIGWVDATNVTRTLDENTATEDRYRLTFQFDEGLSALPTGLYDVRITFSGGPRVYTIVDGYDHP